LLLLKQLSFASPSLIRIVQGACAAHRVGRLEISDVSGTPWKTRHSGRFYAQALEMPVGVIESLLQVCILELKLLDPIVLGNVPVAVLRPPCTKHRAADEVVPAKLLARHFRSDFSQQIQEVRF
jgi:hypothetical protein